MLKILLSLILLLTVCAGTSLGVLYRCIDAKGAIMITDNPTNLPEGCSVSLIKDLPKLGILPATSSSSSLVAPPGPSSGDNPADEPLTAEADAYEKLKADAKDLARQYDAVRKRVFRSTSSKNRMNAMRELSEIRNQKRGLLTGIASATLTSVHKEELTNILATIAEQ